MVIKYERNGGINMLERLETEVTDADISKDRMDFKMSNLALRPITWHYIALYCIVCVQRNQGNLCELFLNRIHYKSFTKYYNKIQFRIGTNAIHKFPTNNKLPLSKNAETSRLFVIRFSHNRKHL